MATTRLYLMRHGDAGDRPAFTGPDSERPLSGVGRTRSRYMGMRMKKAGVRPGLVLASPLLRARQTAEIAAKALEVSESVAVDERVGPGFDVTTVGLILAEFGGVGESYSRRARAGLLIDGLRADRRRRHRHEEGRGRARGRISAARAARPARVAADAGDAVGGGTRSCACRGAVRSWRAGARARPSRGRRPRHPGRCG